MVPPDGLGNGGRPGGGHAPTPRPHGVKTLRSAPGHKDVRSSAGTGAPVRSRAKEQCRVRAGFESASVPLSPHVRPVNRVPIVPQGEVHIPKQPKHGEPVLMRMHRDLNQVSRGARDRNGSRPTRASRGSCQMS